MPSPAWARPEVLPPPVTVILVMVPFSLMIAAMSGASLSVFAVLGTDCEWAVSSIGESLETVSPQASMRMLVVVKAKGIRKAVSNARPVRSQCVFARPCALKIP